ncbi:2OG-Fe(II) oxygenase, partial [Fodinicola feengrottensis]|uniref:2OG-Fe(II) oxygenase n=1 Tax=Fodinicola feengrottensis TaxID=435914 RepID=UPI002441E1F0
MARYRFGSGQYRYFDYPLPDLVSELRHAFYPYLLPIARDWAEKLHKPAPWPDDLDEWLAMCHAAGQPRSTPILLRYIAKRLNAAAKSRARYGDLVFPPLQVVDRPWTGRPG